MIVFDLKCSGDHVFEAWFSSSSAFAEQKERSLLMCPVCGSADVDKAVMAPNVTAKGNQRAVVVASESAAAPVATPPPAVPAELVQAMQRVAAMQAEAIKSSTWVGNDFEKQARAMDAGEVPQGQIHGQATPEQAQALIEDGIGVMPLLIPVVPPEERN